MNDNVRYPRRTWLLRSLALIGALLCLAPLALAHDFKVGAIEIQHPWARATPKGATIAGGYVKLTNTGKEPDRLIGGSLPIAGRFEIHQMSMNNGVMQMRPVTGGLEIKPGESLELKPGSYHLMFLDLKAPLVQKQLLKGTLVFEKAGTVEIEYTIEPVGSTPAHSRPNPHSGH
jgi:periplasmic copper chaperone A